MSKCILLLAAALSVLGCQRNELIQPSPEPATGPFSTQVKPIFARNCGGADCHGGGAHGFAGGLDLRTWDGVFKGSRYGTVVVPGSPFMSHLVHSINRFDTTISPISSIAMPAGRDPLPAEDVRAIVNWIHDGARNDQAQLPFPEPRPQGKVFFTSQYTDLVGVVDVETGRVMRYVTAGNSLPIAGPTQSPHNVQIDDQGRFFYVTLIVGNKLKKFDAVTNQQIGEVPVGLSPAHVVLTRDGKTAYVTNFNTSVGQVYKVATDSMRVVRIIREPQTVPLFMKSTHGARLSQDGKYLYVGNNGTGFITVIRTEDDSILTHVPVVDSLPPFGSGEYAPYQIAVHPNDQFIYVTLNGRAAVSVIERVPVVPIGGGDLFIWRKTIPVGQRPLQCEVTRDGRFLYVCNQRSASVSVINAQTNTKILDITNVGKQPHGIDISDDSRTVYVTCENTSTPDPPHHPLVGGTTPGYLVMIDVATNQVFTRVEVGGFAAGVSVTPGRGN